MPAGLLTLVSQLSPPGLLLVCLAWLYLSEVRRRRGGDVSEQLRHNLDAVAAAVDEQHREAHRLAEEQIGAMREMREAISELVGQIREMREEGARRGNRILDVLADTRRRLPDAVGGE